MMASLNKLIHLSIHLYLSVGVSVEYWRASRQLESSEKLRMVMSGAGSTLRAPQPPATLRADSQQTVDVVDT